LGGSSDQVRRGPSDEWREQRKNMKRKIAVLTLCAVVFALSYSASAQPTKIPRIGYLTAVSPPSIPARIEAFRQGLRELGYVEGENIVIEWRYAEGKLDRLPALAADVVRLKVDVIVAGGPSPTRAAKEATITIPIVMTNEGDSAGTGFVASLARPGGNITGLSRLAPELTGKQMELLKEVAPPALPGGRLRESNQSELLASVKRDQTRRRALAVKLQYLDVQGPKDFETAFREASKERANAILVLLSGPVLNSHRTQVVDLVVKNRLPAMYAAAEWVEDGGL
jgi:putative tryptophan/tyrosine transport system substrate-binding protein